MSCMPLCHMKRMWALLQFLNQWASSASQQCGQYSSERARPWQAYGPVMILSAFLRPTISLGTPLGHTVPIIDGGVHGEIEGRKGTMPVA